MWCEEDLGEFALATAHALEEAPEDEEEGEDHEAHEEERLRVHRLAPLTGQPVRWVCKKRGTRLMRVVRKVIKRKGHGVDWILCPITSILLKPRRMKKVERIAVDASCGIIYPLSETTLNFCQAVRGILEQLQQRPQKIK